LTRKIETALSDPGEAVAEWRRRVVQRKCRDEYLSLQWFRNRLEAKVGIERWRRHYNEVRPHSIFEYLTPMEFKTSGATNPVDAIFQ
jgi:putative transposase